MLKDFFQRNIDLTNQLRSQHFKYTEYLNKGKYKLKQKFFGKGKKHYDFDINSQQYFHQEIDDISFQSSQAQDQFFNLVNSFINKPLNVKNSTKINSNQTSKQSQPLLTYPLSIFNPSQCRTLLSKHFFGKVYNLKYKKYLILQRYYNCDSQKKQQQILPFIQSRTQLIDKQIQISMSRQTRLNQQDYFEESFVQGGKPIPISQTGQPIYKYLDQQECWYSNISRDDIIVYTRNIEFKRQLLNQFYYPIESQLKAIVVRDGLEILFNVEEEFEKNSTSLNKRVTNMADEFNFLVEKQLELISPGNLVEKQNLNSFGYTIFGVLSNSPVALPLYPAIYPQLLQTFNKATKLFFKDLQFKTHQNIISTLPKLNSFCQILFKYQNHQILEGKKQIKLGLEDDIDVRKQLYTMLQEIWVRKYVTLVFQRYDYKLEIKSVDWPIQSITQEIQRQNNRKKIFQKPDTSIQQLIRLLTFNDFVSFRRHMKKRAQKIVQRCQSKYFDMQNINHFNKKSDQKMTLQQLSSLFKVKFNKQEPQKQPFLKNNSNMFFNQIMKKYWIVNSAQIQIQQTLKCLKIRQDRAKLMNVLNGMRCYHRNLCLDLRVISGEQFKFKLQDSFLINSNKQVVQNFQKTIKQTATFFTKNSTDNINGKVNQQFQLPQRYQERSMLYKKDVVECKFFTHQKASSQSKTNHVPHILVSNGKRRKSQIIYGIVLDSDLPLVQKRILQFSTKIINQYQRYIKITSRQQIVDRVQLLRIFYQCELKFLYSKFRLIEKYYYLYENTTSVLDAFKISKLIVELMHKNPVIDFQSMDNNITFEDIYQYQIEAFKQEEAVLEKMIVKLKAEQQRKVETFHQRYCQLSKVPLSAQIYLYRDLQPKQKSKTRLQRMNSMASKMSSKSSKGQMKRNGFNQNSQIKQQFDEQDSNAGESFDIQNYDQYLLKKDMDAIFDDMVQPDENKESGPINTAVQQSIVLNPRFQGGPHPFNYSCQDIKITSDKKQNILTFYQSLSFAANVREIIKNLQLKFINMYGHVSKNYQFCLLKVIGKMMNQILLKPLKSIPRWKQYQSFDPYHEVVTNATKFYQQVMSSALEPPSNIQMAIASTLEKHQQKIPTFSVLSVFDYYSIQSLICLKKPANTASYRQLALGINFLTYLNIRQSLFQIQLKRQRLIESYEKLATNCGSVAQRYGSMYSRSGQNDSFISIQQIRQYRDQHYSVPVFPEVIQQLKVLIQCQKADVQLFETILMSSKIKVQDYIIMKNEIGKNYLNSRFDQSRLLAKDLKTFKMIKNRLGGEISNIFQEQFKKNSFLKVKQQLKLKVQKLTKQVLQADVSNKITLPKQKISQYCKNLLQQKYKRKLVLQIIDGYRKDLIDTNSRNIIFVETDCLLRKLRKIINCLPYLKKLFTFASNDDNLDKKVLYDQKKGNQKQHHKFQNDFVKQGKITKPLYIYSRQQLCNQWSSQQTLFRSNNLNQFRMHVIDFTPPKQKDQLFKWLYKIPDYGFNEYQTKANQHFIGQLALPFTGKNSLSEYLQTTYQSDAPRNKFYTIYSYYQTLVEYLESNLLLVSLQMEDDILESLTFLFLNDKIVFQQAFPLNDDVSIHESLQTLQKNYLKTCFNYKNQRQSDKLQIKKRIQAKGYAKNKQHWAVYDQILDFIISKVQSRGVIRENLLPLIKQIQQTLVVTPTKNDIKQRLRLKNQQIQHYFVLSTFQAYLNQQHQNSPIEATFYQYVFPICKWYLGNGLQNYRLTSAHNPINPRFRISSSISQNQNEIQRFILGLSNQKNDNSVKMNTILQRFKSVFLLNSVDVQSTMKQTLKSRINLIANKSGNQQNKNSFASNNSQFNNQSQTKQSSQITLYNYNFLSQGMGLFNSMGEVNRLKIFARMRYFYEKSNQHMKLKNHQPKTLEFQETKLTYIKFLLSNKLQSLSAVVFSGKVKFPTSAKNFKELSTELKQMIEINTFKIFDNFEEYKAENKIQFGKSEQKMLSCTEQAKKDQKLRNVYNFVIKQIIEAKLVREEFKSRVLLQSIKILKNQKVQTVQAKRIINTSLIPRVHLIASYSSPLVFQRKTYISQQYKLAFAQAFINRFRNKVSRVDLLSSGYGFVITVPDLQDCVNFMNKLLFTFAQKQFRYRLQTNQQYFQIMVQAVNQKNKVINQQKQIIKYLQQKVYNIMQAQYLGKVTKLLHQKTVIQDKLKSVEQSTKGLQDRIRKTVQIQYQKKINALQTENQMLRNKFNQFKQLFVILTKDTAKNNFLNVANTIRDKVGDLLNKRIQIKESFLTSEEDKSNKYQTKKMKFDDKGSVYRQNKQIPSQAQQKIPYSSQDLQRCKLGQDLIHDPYYTTKLITKMRLFNIFKLGCKKINFEEIQNKKTSELKSLHKIQDTVIAQSERQIFVREQLKKTQEDLSKKVAQLERLKQSYELLDNERTKLKILLTGKDKKIEQKQRQAIQNMKKMQQIQKLPTLQVSQSKVQKAQQQKPKISQLRKIHKKKSTRIQKSPFLTNLPVQPSISVYDRFQLSNKDATWRQKCQQLYIQNKKLLNQLEKVQSGMTTPTRQGYSLNLRQRKKSQSINIMSETTSLKKQQQQKRFPNLSFKYNLMKQNGSPF